MTIGTRSRLRRRRRDRVLLAALTTLAATGVLSVPPVEAASECTPGENNCLPTPEQCRTGSYNNFYDGGYPGRFAVCVGAAGHVASYAGGDAATGCGTVILADVIVSADEWGSDPNDCPRVPLAASDAEHSANIKHVSNQPPSRTLPSEGPSDLAFWGKFAFVADYGGVRIFDVSSAPNPKLVADLVCPARQNDVSVWKDILVLSVDAPRTGSRCASTALPERQETIPWGFEGVRLFRISEIVAAAGAVTDRVVKTVEPIAAVAVDCGSHTNTLVPDVDKGRVLVYVSSTGYNAGPRCGPENAAFFGYDPLHRKISIVGIELAAPENARIVSEPRIDAPIFAGDHHEDPIDKTALHRKTISCHDISVFLELDLAAASCLSEGQLWDISDPAHPKTLDAVHIDNKHVEFWHSASFTWDGERVAFLDETERAACAKESQAGRMWFYDVAAPSEPLGSYQLQRGQGGQRCWPHNFNLIPVAGRDVAVVPFHGGGVSVLDFTYPDNAHEIAFYDFGTTPRSETWSAYWYNGYIYANDGLYKGTGDPEPHRGFDIYHLSDLSREGAKRFEYMNPQTQDSIIRGW